LEPITSVVARHRCWEAGFVSRLGHTEDWNLWPDQSRARLWVGARKSFTRCAEQAEMSSRRLLLTLQRKYKANIMKLFFF